MSETIRSLEFIVYGLGLVCASVCTRLSLEDATARLNLQHPTGIASKWAASSDLKFADGTPQPANCPDKPGFKHYLFNC